MSRFNRRQLLKNSAATFSLAALGKLPALDKPDYLIPAKAKRLIYICNSGGISQLDTYDYKPNLNKWDGKELPPSIRGKQRLTTMTSIQGHLKVVASKFKFTRNKKTAIHFSELLPHINSISDEMCLINSMTSEEINHDPGICRLITGSSQVGKASIGSWLSYGLESLNKNLPPFVVMLSTISDNNQSINERLWNSGYLPSEHQGTKFYPGKDPVLFLNSPKSITPKIRQKQIDLIDKLNRIKYEEVKDREILARTQQYKMAVKMQTSIPSLTDLSKESDDTFAMYGPDSKIPGSYANNCLLARRMIERNIRCVQLFHRGWDHHENLVDNLQTSCKTADQPTAALIKDLKQRGLLDDTLIVNTTEFGRTAYSQGNPEHKDWGRDHHGRCFSSWLAGAGIKKGTQYGKSDGFSYNVAENPVSIEQLNATIFNIMGIDHQKLSYFHQGLNQRLTGVDPVKAIQGILA